MHEIPLDYVISHKNRTVYTLNSADSKILYNYRFINKVIKVIEFDKFQWWLTFSYELESLVD
jgi:hypothetical protein